LSVHQYLSLHEKCALLIYFCFKVRNKKKGTWLYTLYLILVNIFVAVLWAKMFWLDLPLYKCIMFFFFNLKQKTSDTNKSLVLNDHSNAFFVLKVNPSLVQSFLFQLGRYILTSNNWDKIWNHLNTIFISNHLYTQ
jgi:hypothetical protein